jgi:hypothetical protein
MNNEPNYGLTPCAWWNVNHAPRILRRASMSCRNACYWTVVPTGAAEPGSGGVHTR